MKLLAGLMALASAQEADQGADRGLYGSYDYYGGYYGKSQSAQMGESETLGMRVHTDQLKRPLGNGRQCWQCNEKNYGDCLSTTTSNDEVSHGHVYCKGEEYFCYIHERRIIRHDGNDYNFEKGQPWSSNTETVYQEENLRTDLTNSNAAKDTNIRVQMGCQQPQACLRQQHQNYKIQIGQRFFNKPGGDVNVLPTLHAGHLGLAREGLCRLGYDWLEYAAGQFGVFTTDDDTWRDHEWRNSPDTPLPNTDRRYGAVAPHYHYGKGTESVCHYCCDALQEYDITSASPCNYHVIAQNTVAGQAPSESSLNRITQNVNTVDTAQAMNVMGNIFLERQENWSNPTWYNAEQYHGMFRNPHTQYKRLPISGIYNAPVDPNVNRP